MVGTLDWTLDRAQLALPRNDAFNQGARANWLAKAAMVFA